MTPGIELELEEEVVPEGPGRAIAVASALAVGAVIAGAAARAEPMAPEVVSTEAGRSAAEAETVEVGDPAAPVAQEASILRAVAEGLRSDDPAVRRETAGVLERLARDAEPRRRLALAAALRSLGGRESVLPLCLLVGDPDPSVRVVARGALLAEARR